MSATANVDVSETDWQKCVVDLAHALGWRVLHVRRSIGRRGGARAWQTTTSVDGWPDLWLWHPRRPALGFVALELKSEKGKMRDEQVRVLDELRAAGARVMVARPSDLDAVRALLDPRPTT